MIDNKDAVERLQKTIRRITSRKYSAEDDIRIELAGLLGGESIATLCRWESIEESLYHNLENFIFIFGIWNFRDKNVFRNGYLIKDWKL